MAKKKTNNRPFIPNKYSRFLSKVRHHNFDPDRCWEWMGAGKGNGYGSVNHQGRNVTAHSYSYRLFVGKIPPGFDVCHTCDTRYCVNPDHLFTGSRSDNMGDCKSKGRTAGGNRKHLGETAVQEIKRRIFAGHSYRKIANQMDVNYSTVSAIGRGVSYQQHQRKVTL